MSEGDLCVAGGWVRYVHTVTPSLCFLHLSCGVKKWA